MNDCSKAKRDTIRKLSRRQLLCAAAALASPMIISNRASAANAKMVFVSFGGTTQAAQEKIFVKPFMQETGIEVVTTSGPDVAKTKAMVQSGNVEWDLVNFTGAEASTLARQGLLEKLDYDIIGIRSEDHVNPNWFKEAGIGWYYYGGGIAYDPKRFPGDKHPHDWPGFWDKSIPGRRGLRVRSDEMLELALLADGVAPKSLYPLDVNRAFASLDKVKPLVSNWIKATPETITLVQRNEVDFVYTYSGRVEAARANGASLEFVYENTLSSPSFLAIPKGAKNREAAMKLASYFLRNDLQKQWALDQPGYSPVRRQSIHELPAETKAKIPNSDDPKNAFLDVDWWAANFNTVEKRFQEWLLT